MRLNRRDFVRAGTIGTVGVATASCNAACDWFGRPSLDIRIKGLALVQRSGKTITAHLINGNLVGMGPHEPRLIVPAALIDPSTTVAHTPHPLDATLRLIDLKDKTVTTPATGTGAPDVELEDTPIGSTVPVSNDQWRSIRHSAKLGTLCGATQITDSSKFYGSVQVNHGRMLCAPPDSIVGSTTVWTFKHPTTGQPVCPPQAVSNVLVCRTKVNRSGAAFMIGSQTLVFVPGQSGQVTIDNSPPAGTMGMCSGGALVCADHLSVLYDMVNATVKPVAVGAAPPPPPQVDPNYCPPGFMDA